MTKEQILQTHEEIRQRHVYSKYITSNEIVELPIHGSSDFGFLLGALWMAEWKDAQFKEYLEKKMKAELSATGKVVL